MPRETKANHATKEERINKVYELLVIGLNRYRIWQYVTSDEKGKTLFRDVSRRQLDRYIAEANGMLASERDFHREREFARAKARLDNLYERCLKIQDYARCHAVQRELNALMSLYEPPAAQTLRFEGLDPAQLKVFVDALKLHDLVPSDVFNSILAELAQAKSHERR